MPDVVGLLSRFGPRCTFCGELATRITVPAMGISYLFEVWCEDFSILIQSDSFEHADAVAHTWLSDLVEGDLVRKGNANFRINVLVPNREGWYYCDKHSHSDHRIGYRELSCAQVVRGLSIEAPVERLTRFERILDSDA